MKINKLRVTQSGLRNTPQVAAMINSIESGGRFDDPTIDKYCKDNPGSYRSPLIKIARFPDDELFIADGHHRILAIKLGGRNFLHENEFQINEWSYDEYLDINFEQNWVTPFDPRVDFRFPDFLEFKKAVKENLKISREAATDYILTHPHLYKEEKRYEDIEALGRDIGLV